MKKSVTVCMPNYNHAEHLSTRIPSLLEALPADGELIIVDDGSTDHSKEIIVAYAQKDPRLIPIFFPENRGVCAAINTSIDAAQGIYIAFLAADDFIYPDFFTKLLNFSKAHPGYSVYTSDFGYCKNDTLDPAFFKSTPLIANQKNTRQFSPEQFIEASWTSCFWVPAHSSIIETDWVRKMGKFDASLHHCSDWFLIHTIVVMGGVAYLPETLSILKIHASTFSWKILKDKALMFKIHMRIFKILSTRENREPRRRLMKASTFYAIVRERLWALCLRPKYWDWLAYGAALYAKRHLKRLFYPNAP